ncbi:MAG: hypothetical protein HY063_06580 [Bacteroidetes bacterium]|nr:hypothetical protein [Bacteroidota bacterium]
MSINDMLYLHQQSIEELFIYMVEKDKENKELKNKLEKQDKMIELLSDKIEKLENKIK